MSKQRILELCEKLCDERDKENGLRSIGKIGFIKQNILLNCMLCGIPLELDEIDSYARNVVKQEYAYLFKNVKKKKSGGQPRKVYLHTDEKETVEYFWHEDLLYQ